MLSGHYGDIEAVPQTKAGTQKTVMRTLIGKTENAPVFSMRVLTIEPGGLIGMHDHPWEHEIFVISGSGMALTETRKVEMRPGDFFFIPASEVHGFDNVGDEPLEFVCCIPLKWE